MNRGSIAIVDALGFKGIWGAPDKPTTAILESLKKIGAAARAAAEDEAANLGPRGLPPLVRKLLKEPFVKVVQLSDTIVVAAGRRPRQRALRKSDLEKWQAEYGLDFPAVEDVFDWTLREMVCDCVCTIMRVAALCDPPLVYRGVVTTGKFAIDQNFLLGPAVDEAAELMNLADGALVWLAPSAMGIAKNEDNEMRKRWEEMAIYYRVPLKGGQRIRSRVLNPFFHCKPEDRKKVETRILRRMNSPRLDVVIKRHNTTDFFEAIRSRERMRALAEKYKKKETKSAPAA